MATFADLSTLLLTFFVLLLSFANMDVIKFQDMAGSIKDAFGYREDNLGNFHPEMLARRTKVRSSIEQELLGGPRKKRRKMTRKIRDLINKRQLKGKLSAATNEEGMVIRVNDSVMFGGGNNRMKLAAFPILDEIAKVLSEYPCDIVVQGHTDNKPITSRRFPSNWELSASRAIEVMRYLVEQGGIDPRRIGAAGYADQRPLVPNTTRVNRLKNRRVEFLCHRPLLSKPTVYKTDADGNVVGEDGQKATAPTEAEPLTPPPEGEEGEGAEGEATEGEGEGAEGEGEGEGAEGEATEGEAAEGAEED